MRLGSGTTRLVPDSYNAAALHTQRIAGPLVTAFATPHRLGDGTAALEGRGVGGVTVSDVAGFGSGRTPRGVAWLADHVEACPRRRWRRLRRPDSATIAALIADVARVVRARTGAVAGDVR